MEKAFIHATTHTSKKTGKTIQRKAYTDKRIAKQVVAKDKIRIPSIKNKSPKQVKEELHDERDKLKKKLEEVRRHKEDLIEAKNKGETHTDKGISVAHEHHIDKHEKNVHEKLENTNHKIMLHENRYELLREKTEKSREKAKVKREVKKVVVKKEESKKTRSEAMIGNQNAKKFGSHKEYSDWLRRQPEDVKESHKLDRIDGELTALWPKKIKESKKVEVKKLEPQKPEEAKPRVKKAVVVPKEKIIDFGEKIGGARKDIAERGFKMTGGAKGEGPAWKRRYEVNEVASGSYKGKFVLSDNKASRYSSGRIVNKYFDTRKEAENALPLAVVSLKHRVVPSQRENKDDPQKYEIIRDVSSRKRPVIKDGFDSREDALKHLVKNAEEIINKKLRLDDAKICKRIIRYIQRSKRKERIPKNSE